MAERTLRALLAANTRCTSSGCLIWQRYLNAAGYGSLTMDGRTHLAHRVAYELDKGPLAVGETIDHVCHTRDDRCPGGRACEHRACLNTDHMEAVTQAENSRRKRGRRAACRHGHDFTPENTYIDPVGDRYCRACNAAAQRRRKLRMVEVKS